MKKIVLIQWVLILSLLNLVHFAIADTGFHIKLSSGPGHMQNGNDFQKLFDSTRERWTAIGYQGNFDLSFSRSLAEGNVQVVFQLTDNFGVGLGAGYLEKSWTQNPDVSYNLGTPGHLNGHNDFKFQSIPLTLEAILSISTGRFTFNLYSGGGYYLNRLQLHFTADSSEPSKPGKSDWTSYLDQDFVSDWNGGLGFHAGIGMEVSLSSHLALVVDGIYRRAQFDDFLGKYDSQETENWAGGHNEITYHSDKALAWCKGITSGSQLWYYLDISETKPTSFFCLNSFRVDLTGIYVRIGFKIKL